MLEFNDAEGVEQLAPDDKHVSWFVFLRLLKQELAKVFLPQALHVHRTQQMKMHPCQSLYSSCEHSKSFNFDIRN